MKSQPYNTFWQRIHNSAKDRGFPLRAMFELTYRCNFKCGHCYVPQSYRKYGELKTKEVFSILDQLADIGCFYLGFTGGEPFIRKDIMDILWYAKKKGFEVIVYTNGSFIDKHIADELADLRPNKVDITIHSIREDTFDQISGVSGSHKRVFKGIEFLRRKKVALGFKTCVLKENESEIKEIQDFAASLNALHRLDDRLSARLDGSREPFKHRGKIKEELGKSNTVYREISECDLLPGISKRTLSGATPKIYGVAPERVRNLGYYKKRIINNLFKCGVGLSQAAITPLGELKMCLMIDWPKYKLKVSGSRYQVTGNISPSPCPLPKGERVFGQGETSNLKNAWGRLKELVRGIRLDENYKCDTCELEPYCKWCPARAWLENKSFTNCDSESCKWAQNRKQEFLVGGAV